jgi:hypothetical protein
VLVVEADKARSRIGTASDCYLVSAFCAFLGATNVLGSSQNTPNVFLLGYRLM